MKDLPCAVCGTFGNYDVMFAPNFDVEKADVDPMQFSSRVMHDVLHFQIVRCKGCGLTYSNPIFEDEKIAKLYEGSGFNYEEYVGGIANDCYGYYLSKLDAYQQKKGSILEIGSSNGMFLETAAKQGYPSVHGVEPSKIAVDSIRADLRKNVKHGMFKEGLFPDATFDVVAFFQTFDHVLDPNSFLKGVYKALKPGGMVLALNHDVQSWSAKLLKTKSPIFHIQHVYLWDYTTIRKIFEKHGFEVLEVGSAFNDYPLSYWVEISPIPVWLRSFLKGCLKAVGLHDFKYKFHAGNLYCIARKPKTAPGVAAGRPAQAQAAA